MALIYSPNTSSIKLNILIVDDSLLVCDNLKDIITKIGHTPYYETDPERAIELFEKNNKQQESKVDVIIIDQSMPKMDGLTFIKKIKAIDSDVYFIMFTIEGENSKLEEDAIELDIFTFIYKKDPERIDNIIHALLTIFEEKRREL